MQIDLAGRTALVTGGAGGIGSACVRALADTGAAVAIGHLGTAEAAAALRAEIEARGGRAAVLEADVADRHAVERLFDGIETTLGPVDILVNAAGIASRRPLLEVDFEEWDRVLAINLNGTFHCARACARRLLARGAPGAIVNVSSIHGRVAKAGMGAYCTSKAAVDMFTKQLAVELGPHRIRVAAVAPGTIRTDINVPLYRSTRPEDVALQRATLKRVPAGDFGEPDDIGAMVAFLASPLARYVTGTTVYVDGGYTAEGTPRM